MQFFAEVKIRTFGQSLAGDLANTSISINGTFIAWGNV